MITTDDSGYDPGVDSNGMIVGRLDFTTSGVTIDGTSIPGTLNSFVWLRDNQTVIEALGGINGGTSALMNARSGN